MKRYTDRVREQAAPYLASDEMLQQVFWGGVSKAGGLTADPQGFAVTDKRVLVISKKGALIAELPRSVKFVPERAGRFHLDSASGGLVGMKWIDVQFNFPQYNKKVRFNSWSFGAMLAADGREGEKHGLYGKIRILH